MRANEPLGLVSQGAIFILIAVDADLGVDVEFRSVGNGPLILIRIKAKMIGRDKVDDFPLCSTSSSTL